MQRRDRGLGQVPGELTRMATAQPWLAVLVPSHNGERWLEAALQSVVDQHEPGIEVILIDSSATRDSLEIAERFAGPLDIRIEHRPALLSWQAKTNAAAAMARGPWLCMLHQDDAWEPGRAAALRRWIDEAPDVIMHLHPAYIVDAKMRRLGVWRCPLPAEDAPSVRQEEVLERLLVQNFIAIPTPVFQRDAYLAVGGLDEQLWYTADWDFYLKMLGLGNIRYHENILACFRIHGGSLTLSGSRSLDDFRNQLQVVLDRHIGNLVVRQGQVRRLAAASVAVNVALAAAAQGRFTPMLRAAAALLRLGPRQLYRYLTYSRLLERALPRLKARLMGTL